MDVQRARKNLLAEWFSSERWFAYMYLQCMSFCLGIEVSLFTARPKLDDINLQHKFVLLSALGNRRIVRLSDFYFSSLSEDIYDPTRTRTYSEISG